MKQLRQLARQGYRTAVERSPLGRRIFWRVATQNAVALTFDDGPDPEQTPRLLDTLAEYDARATFFVIGEHVDRYPALVRRIVDEGHAVGNHTYSHLRCRELDYATLARQLDRTDAALEAALGFRFIAQPLFRPPFGELRADQALYLAAKGRSLAFWNRDTRDYRGASAPEIAALSTQLAAGDVVLLHDRFPATVKALPSLLEAIRAKGLQTTALGVACRPEGTSPGPSLVRKGAFH